MFNLFKSDPKAKIQKEIDRISEKALRMQRDGKLREYGQLIQQIEDLEKEKAQLD